MRYHHFEGQVSGNIYDRHLIKRMLKYLAPYKYYLLGSLALLFSISLLDLIGPYLTKIAIDEYIPLKDLSGLNKISLLFIGVLILEFGVRFGQIQVMQYTGQRVMQDLRMDLLRHLQCLSLGFFDKQPVGALMTRLIGDVEVLNEMVTSGVVSILGDLFMLLGIMGVLLWMNLILALLVFSVLPLVFGVALLFRKKVRESFLQIRIRMAKINAFLQENISGMSIIQVFCRERKNLAQFKKINGDYLESYLKTIFYYALFFPALEIITALALALIIWNGGGQVLRGTLTFGVLVAFIEYTQRFFRPINDLSEKYNILLSAMAAAERIFKLLDKQSQIKPPSQPRNFGDLSRGIVFNKVWFAYNNDDYILKDISFCVSRGENVALVGLTGSGKTSIISLLNRFYEFNRGQILIDEKDIRQLNLQQWRSKISLVLQEPFLFSGNILNNIRLGREDISMAQVEQAARKANAHSFISRLPKGYYEPIQERGANLSGGQRQLIAFARALVFNPQLLILDEATSSVDSQTETLIQNALEKLLSQRTSIVIAHRLSTVQRADKIIVLDKGRIVEQGTHQQLLDKQGAYYWLHQLQFRE
jgi:ATP-binding cassette subfamily B multidrug efflux pump